MNFSKIKSDIEAMYGPKKQEDSSEFFAFHFVRPVSFWIATMFAIFNVSANTVTWLSLVVGLIGIFAFTVDGYMADLVGSILIFVWLILDHVDGNLARYYRTQGSYGDFLDSIICYVIFAITPVAIAHSVASGNPMLSAPTVYFFGWLWSMGFILPRLIYQKFKQQLRWIKDYYQTLRTRVISIFLLRE